MHENHRDEQPSPTRDEGYDGVAPTAHHPRRWLIPAVATGLVLGLLATALGAVIYLRGNIETLDVGDSLAMPGVPGVGAGAAAPPASARTPADTEIDEDPLNILVMGSDTRQGQGAGYGPESLIDGARSDTTLVVHLSGDRRSVTALSIPRDLLTTIPSCELADGSTSQPYEDRFNAAFYLGGPECTIRAVTELTGIPIHHFAVVDFRGFTDVVDALGGVEVCLAEPVDDPLANLDLPAGVHRIDGEQALGFVRTRTGGLGDGSDLARIQRQQEFLASMVREASSLSLFSNPIELFRTLDAITRSLTVDDGLADVGSILDVVTSLTAVGPDGVTFVTLPTYYSADYLTVRLDRGRATPVLDSIIVDRPWPAPVADVAPGSLAVRPGSVELTVVDRSGPSGPGEDASAYLEALGYSVADVWTDDAIGQSVVRHGRGAARHAEVVAATMPGVQVIRDPAVDGVRLVVGTDFDASQLRRLPQAAFSSPSDGDAEWSATRQGTSQGGTRSAAEGACVS